jgi:phosphatidate cytidylyltransferase
MAFNWKSFKTRTLTAAIFVVVMLAGVLINRWTFFILFSVIHFGCWWEYLKLVEKIYKTQIDVVVKYVLLIVGYIIFLVFGFPNSTIFVGWAVIPSFNFKWLFYLLLVICVAAFLFQNKKTPNKAKWLSVAGFIYISMSLGLMIGLYEFTISETINGPFDAVTLETQYMIPLVIIFTLWINDTMAYLVGSLIGRRSLSKISPQKTWEGTIGGILLAIMVMGIIGYLLLTVKIIDAIFISMLASISGTFGDLLESKLKRMAGVKDSGHIMPGHGGFLDRFDSLLVAIPFVWLYVYFFMQ